ncbi:MAG: twin-arginine translocase TatA/TatE family subunit [Chloroflexi bacterium]|nr:twin-arginine translocase TatA/TatE family subunit [Chloroflexota bacterium]
MEILGVGPSELIFIIIIALIVLGPKDMQKAGSTLGKWLRKIMTSDGWKLFQQTSREIQTLPNRLMREAAIDELKDIQKDVTQSLDSVQKNLRPSQPASSLTPNRSAVSEPENTILPTPTRAAEDDDQNA